MKTSYLWQLVTNHSLHFTHPINILNIVDITISILCFDFDFHNFIIRKITKREKVIIGTMVVKKMIKQWTKIVQ